MSAVSTLCARTGSGVRNLLTDKQRNRTDAAIAGLVPEVQDIARIHLAKCASAGIDLIIVQALRTMEEQAEISKDPKKTNAKAGYSWHNFGRAYDVAVVEDGNVVWTSDKYGHAAVIGKGLGLVWGGDFKTVKGDIGHYEYHPNLSLAQARAAAGITS